MRDAADSEKMTREAELRRDFESAIEGILALDPEPSGLVSSTRSFRFGKYDISICAQHSDKVSVSRSGLDAPIRKCRGVGLTV